MPSRSSLKIFKVYGIEVRIDYSWFIIFALVAYLFGFTYFPWVLAETAKWLIAVITLVTAVLFFLSILIHEISHSIVSIRSGIPVRSITLFVFGGIAQIEKEPDTPSKELIISLAGPFASFFLAIIFGTVWLLGRFIPEISEPAKYLTFINIALGAFNLLPGFPLDGGRVLRSIIWRSTKNFEKATIIATNIGKAIGFAIIAVGIFYIFRGAFFNGIWLMLIGWFLQSTAAQSHAQILMQKSLKGVKVKDIINTDVLSVPGDTSVRDLIDNYFMKYKFSKFPVIDNLNDENYLGIISLNDIKALPRDKWETTKISEVVNVFIDEDRVEPGMELYDAIKKMGEGSISALVTVKDGKITGILTNTDIMQYIKFKSQLGI